MKPSRKKKAGSVVAALVQINLCLVILAENASNYSQELAVEVGKLRNIIKEVPNA